MSPDGSPAFATVVLLKAKKITTTDAAGVFEFGGLPPVKDTLLITSVQTNLLALAVQTQPGAPLNLGDLHLTFSFGNLQHVEVVGRANLSYKSDYSYLGTKTPTLTSEIPQSISTITSEKIKDRLDFTLKEAADQVSGVNDYSGYDEYTIRGFLADNARMINGLRGYNTSYTSPMLVNVDRIEILKGPSATLYANCDPGGTINLVTKKPLAQAAAEVDLSGGSWDLFRAQADLTGPLNPAKTLLFRFNAGYNNTQSFRDLLFSKSYELAPSFSFVPNDRLQVNVDFSLSHIHTMLDRGQPGYADGLSLRATPISLTAAQPGDFLKETDLASNVLLSVRLAKGITFNSGFLNYQTYQDVTNHGVQGYITNDSVDLYYTTWTYRTSTNTLSNYLNFRFSTGLLSHQLVLGYDYVKSWVNLNQQYFELPGQFGQGSGVVGTFSLKNPVYRNQPVGEYQVSSFDSDATDVDASQYHTQGAYLQDQMRLRQWSFLIGLRQETYRADGTQQDSSQQNFVHIFLPRIGLVYAFRPNISFYGTYNKGFDPFEASASTQVFDAPFKPVTSELEEVGGKFSWFGDKLTTTLSLYQLTLHNVAVNAGDTSNPNLYVQQGKDRSRGIEVEANGNILPNLSVSFSYAYCLARVIQSVIPSQNGTLMENAPKNSSNGLVKYQFSRGALKRWGLIGGFTQAGTRNTLAPGFTLPGYITVDAGLQYTRQHVIAAINCSNLANTTYWIGAYNNINKWPGSPRRLVLSVGYKF